MRRGDRLNRDASLPDQRLVIELRQVDADGLPQLSHFLLLLLFLYCSLPAPPMLVPVRDRCLRYTGSPFSFIFMAAEKVSKTNGNDFFTRGLEWH